MLAAPENYRGIKFVRISSLPAEQKNQIWSSFNINLVIKILKEEALLNDCLQYNHYVAWYKNIFEPHRKATLEVTTPSTFKIAS